LATPRLILALFQAIIWLTYSAIPVGLLYKSGLLDGTATPQAADDAAVSWKWQALVVANYLIPYIILVFLQFKSLRRFS
jgi:hypothetical protein